MHIIQVMAARTLRNIVSNKCKANSEALVMHISRMLSIGLTYTRITRDTHKSFSFSYEIAFQKSFSICFFNQ